MMNKSLLLIFLFTPFLLISGCNQKEIDIFPFAITYMFDQKDTYYIGYGVEFNELTEESSILQRALNDISIEIPNVEVIIVDFPNEQSLDSWLSQEPYQMPFEVLEGQRYLIIFSSKDKKIHDASQLTLEFNDFIFLHEH